MHPGFTAAVARLELVRHTTSRRWFPARSRRPRFCGALRGSPDSGFCPAAALLSDSEPVFMKSRDIFSGRSPPMDPTRPKLPKEAIELYNLFIHGRISRRDFTRRVQRFATGGLAAATVIEALMPNYALGQQVSKTDDRIKATYEPVPSPQGNGSIKGYLVRPCSADSRSARPVK